MAVCRWTHTAARARCVAAAAVCLFAGGCEEYETPPEVTLVVPPTGTFFVGDPIALQFSMPVDVDTLAIRVWADDRDLENELRSGSPLLDGCTAAPGSCGANSLTVDGSGTSATFVADPATLGRPDVPLLLEVVPGLRGRNGAVRRYRELFDFQFKPTEVDETPVAFNEGAHTLVAILDEPLPVIINLLCDFDRGPGNAVAVLGAEGVPVDGAPEQTGEPSELRLETGERGYVIFADVALRLAPDGTRFFESEPFTIALRFGSIRARIGGTRLTGVVSDDPDTGRQRIDGTMSFETFGIDVDGQAPFDYPPGSTTFVARWYERDEMPPGSPTICGSLCGDVPQQCDPPEGFPGEGFCE